MKQFKLYACLFLFSFLIVSGFSFVEKPFEKLDVLILSGDIAGAEAEIESLNNDTSIITSKVVTTLRCYEKILKVLKAGDRYKENEAIFSRTVMGEDDISKIEGAYRSFGIAWNDLTQKGNGISNGEIVSQLNSLRDEINEKYKTARQQYEAAYEKRMEEQEKLRLAEEARRKEQAERELAKRRAEEERLKAEEKRLEDEYARELAEMEAEKARAEAEKITEQEALKAKLNELDAIAIGEGFKGLNKEYGVARFLYFASKNGNLEDGLNQVFWSNLSQKDLKSDQKFKLSQVVDGLEIYQLDEWGGISNGWISLSIAVPAESMPMEGQRLKHEFYIFEGNIEFSTVVGTTRIVQKFSPIDIFEESL